MDTIDLILQAKMAELQLLEAEMEAAMHPKGDMNFEYAALLSPIIHLTQREIDYFQRLKAIPAPAQEHSFLSHLQELLADEWRSLLITVDITSHFGYSGPVIEISKMKARHQLKCTFHAKPELTAFLHYGFKQDFLHLGWTAHQNDKVFHYKTRVKTTDEQIAFHQWMSRTLLEPLQYVWSKADRQYYQLSK